MTVAEQITALQAQLDALKAQTATPALSPLDAAWAKFPLPWRADTDAVRDGDHDVVAWTSYLVDSTTHRDAIANLLAAAPTMLAALRSALEALNRNGCYRTAHIVGAAIAAAEGRSA